MYYLIETEYVGPNTADSSGVIIGERWHKMQVWTKPGKTNMSHEERIEGWLGTTNDWDAHAHGEFPTLEQARQAAHDRGFTVESIDPDAVAFEEQPGDEPVEQWITPAGAREQWEAADWLQHINICDEYGITPETTDDEIGAIAERIDAEAVSEQNVELHNTTDVLEKARDELRNEDNGKEDA